MMGGCLGTILFSLSRDQIQVHIEAAPSTTAMRPLVKVNQAWASFLAVTRSETLRFSVVSFQSEDGNSHLS
jgi:hypothetical protein